MISRERSIKGQTVQSYLDILEGSSEFLNVFKRLKSNSGKVAMVLIIMELLQLIKCAIQEFRAGR